MENQAQLDYELLLQPKDVNEQMKMMIFACPSVNLFSKRTRIQCMSTNLSVRPKKNISVCPKIELTNTHVRFPEQLYECYFVSNKIRDGRCPLTPLFQPQLIPPTWKQLVRDELEIVRSVATAFSLRQHHC